MMESVPERQPELAGEDWRATGLLRVESRLMRTRAVGVRGGLLTLVPFRNTTLLYHAKWQSQTPRELFSRFFFGGAAGRPLADGLWPLAVGGKEKPRHRLTFARTPTAGERLRRVRWVTNPRARTFAPWRCGAHITYIMPSGCQVDQNGNPCVSTVRSGQAFRRPDRPTLDRS